MEIRADFKMEVLMSDSIYDQKFDVVICGGGVSGCTAAIAAARSGCNDLDAVSTVSSVKL